MQLNPFSPCSSDAVREVSKIMKPLRMVQLPDLEIPASRQTFNLMCTDYENLSISKIFRTFRSNNIRFSNPANSMSYFRVLRCPSRHPVTPYIFTQYHTPFDSPCNSTCLLSTMPSLLVEYQPQPFVRPSPSSRSAVKEIRPT